MSTEAVMRLLDQVTPVRMFAGCSVLSATVMIVGTCMMFDTSGPLPPPRDPPPAAEQSAVSSYRYKEGFFKALVEEDAQKCKIKNFNFARFKKGNRHDVEFNGNQTIRPGLKLETNNLVLQGVKKRIWVGAEGEGFRSAHLILAITNKTDSHLAYRVLTNVRGTCHGKGAIAHNAMVLKPKERIERTECLLRAKAIIKILEVEVMRVSPVGHCYLSRLDPLQIRASRRTAEGHHMPDGLSQCRLLPWRVIQNGMRRGEIRWRDVIDFYSRHNCDEYSFFAGYEHSRKGPERLPMIPPKDR